MCDIMPHIQIISRLIVVAIVAPIGTTQQEGMTMAKQPSNATYLELDQSRFTKKQRDAVAGVDKATAALRAAEQAVANAFSQAEVQGFHDDIVKAGGVIEGPRPYWSFRYNKVSIAFLKERGATSRSLKQS